MRKGSPFSVDKTTKLPVVHPRFSLMLSRRDWFAGMALMGLNASDSANFGYDSVEATVDAARRYADAMIVELDKE